MAKPERIREVRLVGTSTFNTGFQGGNATAWALTNATKMPVQSWESGLQYESKPDETLQTRLHGAPPNVPTLRKGSVKFRTYLPTANSAVGGDPISNFMSYVLGGTIATPTARVLTVGTGSNATHINFHNAHGMQNGMGYICGSRGDGRGDGEFRPQLSSINANTVVLGMALRAAPTAGDLFYCGHTLFLDEDQAQIYIDGMAIGQEAEDALQWIGSMGTIKISGTGPGDLPSVEFELMAADWREQQGVSLATTTAPANSRPPVDRHIGGFFIADAATAVTNPVPRSVMKVGDVEIDPGVAYEPIPDPNGVNGIGGWQRMPSSPKLQFTAILSEDMPGLYTDWTTPTAKQAYVQFGHTPQKAFVAEYQKLYLDGAPTRKALGGLAGVAIAMHGEEGDINTSGDLQRSSARFHVF